MNATEGTLRVPGANLYYMVRGSGPVLLMLQGGAGDADGSDGVVGHLSDHYAVVTYDRRGLSRSTLDDLEEALRLETHSDDAHRLLAALTTEPVFVFGSSIGALIGLDLVARHLEQVRTLVVHEPPAPELLPDAERVHAVRAQEDMEETYRLEGMAAAMGKFVAIAGLTFDDREPDVEMPQPSPQRAANTTFFLAHDAGAVRRYRLDLAALQAGTTRIVPACGHSARETWPRQCACALADRLGTALVAFPGGHNGYMLHPRAFAARLREVLDGSPAVDREGKAKTLAVATQALSAATGAPVSGSVLSGDGGESTPPLSRRGAEFDTYYAGTPPWDIGRPQPAFLALAESGALRGRVLDIGCGTGEHTLLAAGLGRGATGIDAAPTAIELAKRKARDRGLAARFLLWDALDLSGLGDQFDTVLDCGLFHVFDDDERSRLVESLRAILVSGGRYYLLCFSDRQPGAWGPRRVSQEEIRTSFASGWRVESIESATFDLTFIPEGALAWLAIITRT